MRVIQGTAERSRQSAVEAAYDHFRVDRQGNLVSGNALDHYRYLVGPFFEWLRETRPWSSTENAEKTIDLAQRGLRNPPPRARSGAIDRGGRREPEEIRRRRREWAAAASPAAPPPSRPETAAQWREISRSTGPKRSEHLHGTGQVRRLRELPVCRCQR